MIARLRALGPRSAASYAEELGWEVEAHDDAPVDPPATLIWADRVIAYRPGGGSERALLEAVAELAIADAQLPSSPADVRTIAAALARPALVQAT